MAGLRFQERRRTFAIVSALGAKSRQLGGFVWSESVFVTGGGLLLGAGLATGLTGVLVKVLTGVFDPPPDYLSVPWGYLGGVLVLTCGTVLAAGTITPPSAAPPGDRGAPGPVTARPR
ncbi:MAG: FtsX-like permease family protein [Solirubrobacteraceae bacterium]